ncbi:glycine-rich cell wall structural protein 1-like [Mizuhopecten yessoensis]|nr:glycine-rich cell wall structural protein 1-like [Mizuhopecten yessoensis]
MRTSLARSALRARRPTSGSRRRSQVRVTSKRRGGVNTATSIKNTSNIDTRHIKQTIIIAKTANIMSPIGTQNNDKTAISSRGSGGVQNSSPARNLEISSTRQRAHLARNRRPNRPNNGQGLPSTSGNGRGNNRNGISGLASSGHRPSTNFGLGNRHSGRSGLSGNLGRQRNTMGGQVGQMGGHGGSMGGHGGQIGGHGGSSGGNGGPMGGHGGSMGGHGGSLGGNVGSMGGLGGSLGGNGGSMGGNGGSTGGHGGSMGGHGGSFGGNGGSMGGHGGSMSGNGGSTGGHVGPSSAHGSSFGSHGRNTGGQGVGSSNGIGIHSGPNSNFRHTQNNGGNPNFNIADMLLSGLGVASSSPNLLALMSSGALNRGGGGMNSAPASAGAGPPDLTGLFRGPDGARLLNSLVQNVMGTSSGGMGVTAPSVVARPSVGKSSGHGGSGSGPHTGSAAHGSNTISTGVNHGPIIIEAGSNIQVGFRHGNGSPSIVIKSVPTTTTPATFLASATDMMLPAMAMELGEELP